MTILVAKLATLFFWNSWGGSPLLLSKDSSGRHREACRAAIPSWVSSNRILQMRARIRKVACLDRGYRMVKPAAAKC